MRRRLAIALLVLPAVGCSGGQTPLAPTGDQAEALHGLFLLMLAVCGGMYLLVIGGLGWSLLRRKRSQGHESAGDAVLERAVKVVAGLIVAGLTVLIVSSFFADRALFATREQDALDVRVTGHQWWWRIEYRDPASGRWIETANELHLPLGRTTRLHLVSADVIHSLWIPNIAGKLDMVPGRRNLLDVTPRREGWFRGQCAEFCGLQHAHMAFDVKVESPAAFASWLAAQARPAAGAGGEGAALFATRCGACHAVRGTPASGRAGPDLTHVAGRRSIAAGTMAMSRGALQGWIAQPQAIKPGTSMPTVTLSGAQADAIADYLAGLR